MKGVRAIAEEFLRAGGKRLRPRLCRAVYAACGGKEDISELEEALECFHKASLVHDDIEDADETRYGLPSIWKAYGIPVAVAVGDWLIARGYALVSGSRFADVPGLLAACARAHERLAEGQGDELAGAGDWKTNAERKTAEGFALAAELGARAAGVDPALYRRYAMAYGMLYQLRDDAADGHAPAEAREWKKEYENETRLLGDQCALGVW